MAGDKKSKPADRRLKTLGPGHGEKSTRTAIGSAGKFTETSSPVAFKGGEYRITERVHGKKEYLHATVRVGDSVVSGKLKVDGVPDPNRLLTPRAAYLAKNPPVHSGKGKMPKGWLKAYWKEHESNYKATKGQYTGYRVKDFPFSPGMQKYFKLQDLEVKGMTRAEARRKRSISAHETAVSRGKSGLIPNQKKIKKEK